MRADSRTEAASKVTQWDEKVALVAEGAVNPNARSVDPAHALTQALGTAQVASAASSALFNGHLVADFTGAQTYQSTLPAANWAFLHNVCQVIAVYSLGTLTGNIALWSTYGAGSPAAFFYANVTSSPHVQLAGAAGANVLTFTGAGGNAVDTRYMLDFSFSNAETPDAVAYKNFTSVYSGDQASAPSAAAPAQSLRLGNLLAASGNWFNGKWCDLLIADRKLSAADQIRMNRYLALRYAA